MKPTEALQQFRTSRSLLPEEKRMVQSLQETLRQGGLHPVDSDVAERIAVANRSRGPAETEHPPDPKLTRR